MTYVLVNHKVEDYDKWKPLYDEGIDKGMLKDMGAKVSFVFRTAEDPNHLVTLTQFENLESAKNFAESDDLRTAMQKAGVKGQPEIYFLEEIERRAI
jgi:heme-degrading monooxygenase HmoA